MAIWGRWGPIPVMGSGLSKNRAGCPFSWRLSGNIWLFWVVCSCKRTRKSMRGMGGVGVSAGGGDGCHGERRGQGC